jgi:glycosyltransferase involved in cell wall biosynthesis
VKVLHLHSGNLYGGVETFLLTLARTRDLAPSMEMSAALSFDDRIAADLRREAVPTSILGSVRLRRPDSVWRARRKLAQLLNGTAFDVAVCHQAWPLAIFGPVVKAAGVPLVSWIHMASVGHWMDRLAARIEPDLIVCNSRFTASMVPSTGARVEIVYAPVVAPVHVAPASTTQARMRKEFNTPAADVVIVQVSRMEAWKGQQIHIEALGRLRALPNWTCWFVGGAQNNTQAKYVRSLERAAKRLDIADRVRFAGHRSDVTDVLAAADIFCQPNTEPEPFGLSFVEALACQRPVVTSAIGGALEIVDDTCGKLVTPRDSSALASVLSEFITDVDMRERLGRGGPQRARALCDPQTQVPAIAAVLQRARCDQTVVH